MDGYYLRIKLVEKPTVSLYYKGMEDNNTVPYALNVIVAFAPEEAMIFDKEQAVKLCKKLNEDKDSLLAHGYTEFEAIKKANSV